MGRRADGKAKIKGMCRPRAVCEELKVVQMTRLSHAGGNTVNDSGEVKGCCKAQYTIADRALGLGSAVAEENEGETATRREQAVTGYARWCDARSARQPGRRDA